MNVVSGAACIGTTGGTGSAANSGSPVKRRTARTNKRFIPKRKRPLRASTNVNVSIQSRKDTKNSAHNPPALIPDTLIHYSPQHLSLTLWLTEGLLVPSTYTVPIPLITGPPLGPLTGVGGEEGRWAAAVAGAPSQQPARPLMRAGAPPSCSTPHAYWVNFFQDDTRRAECISLIMSSIVKVPMYFSTQAL